jgi:hypothetical protein
MKRRRKQTRCSKRMPTTISRSYSLLDDAAQAYNDATKIKPDDPQAWLGLRGLYEKQGPARVDENTDVGLKLAQIYADLYALRLMAGDLN